MFQTKDLTEEQIGKLHEWAAEGDQLADLQKKLKEEFQLNVTYMDMRFAALDLNLEIKSPEVEAPEDQSAIEPDVLPANGGAGGGQGRVSVAVDQITRAGAMISGQVVFSDGERGMWMIDSMGRPSLDPDTAGYQPTEADLISFQGELRAALESESGGIGL